MTEAIHDEHDDGESEMESAPGTETETEHADHETEDDEPSEESPIEGRDWSKRANPERQCRGHRKNGQRCKNAAILGGVVCKFHGGAASHVRNAARARLANAADRMARQLLKMATDDNVSDAVKLRAITEALDRGGLTTKTNVDIEIGSRPIDAIFDTVATELEITSRAAYRRSQGIADFSDALPALAGSDNEIVDAEVVSEPYASRVSDRGQPETPRRFFEPASEPDGPATGHPGGSGGDGMMPFTEAVIAAGEMNRAADVRRAQIHTARRALPPGRG